MGIRDNEDLRRALEGHSINGYPVTVPVFGTGTIQGEGGRTLNITYYRVRPDKPISFEELAKRFNWDTTQKKLDQWLAELKGRGYKDPISVLQGEIQDNLEAGGMASWKDVHEIELINRGCLDPEGNVVCYDFDSGAVSMSPEQVRPGMLLEFHDKKMNKEFPGRVVDVRGKGTDRIVYLETFEPVPFMDAPEAIEPEKIKPGFYSAYTWKIGYGTYEALQKHRYPVPKGKAESDPEGRRSVPHFILKDPIPLADIERFCGTNYPEEPYCVWQSMILYIIPIRPVAVPGKHDGGNFLPLPKEVSRELQVWDVESHTGE